jgi:hypothetical protein
LNSELALARQALYHLSCTPSPFMLELFFRKVSHLPPAGLGL